MGQETGCSIAAFTPNRLSTYQMVGKEDRTGQSICSKCTRRKGNIYPGGRGRYTCTKGSPGPRGLLICLLIAWRIVPFVSHSIAEEIKALEPPGSEVALGLICSCPMHSLIQRAETRVMGSIPGLVNNWILLERRIKKSL